jgi:hypothetical protein
MPALLCLLRLLIPSHRIEDFQTNAWAFLSLSLFFIVVLPLIVVVEISLQLHRSCSSCRRFSSEPNLVGMAVMMMMVQVARYQIHQLALPETQIIAATPRLFASSPALKGNVLRRFFAADGLQVR